MSSSIFDKSTSKVKALSYFRRVLHSFRYGNDNGDNIKHLLFTSIQLTACLFIDYNAAGVHKFSSYFDTIRIRSRKEKPEIPCLFFLFFAFINFYTIINQWNASNGFKSMTSKNGKHDIITWKA